ncbi:hypothetical protein DBT_1849 [Dissulfuribacter thermophilus]|uniref:Uncharacterized protein n=1 Tax=Dissulfuribacter thermophilus TaxID=1156395 RepID=A0A1B9F4B2_9BACT|nr:hypothetical protein DBT_1849 [Dissulfuribacter thermophilus]
MKGSESGFQVKKNQKIYWGLLLRKQGQKMAGKTRQMFLGGIPRLPNWQAQVGKMRMGFRRLDA